MLPFCYNELMKKPVVVICSSASFYKKVNDLAGDLGALGFTVIVPHNARIMAKSGDYDVSHYKTWYDNAADYTKKAELMRGHFDEIEKGDIVLVVNEAKHGHVNYIGPNVLMEMSLAFHLKKPIYLLNGIPEYSDFVEEIKGMGSLPLDGDLTLIDHSVPSSSAHELTLNVYQKQALTTAISSDQNTNIDRSILALGIAGEAGEVADKWKKILAYSSGLYTNDDLNELAKEMGDVLWYLAVFADSFGLNLEAIAQKNLSKLADRKSRSVLKGNGDNR